MSELGILKMKLTKPSRMIHCLYLDYYKYVHVLYTERILVYKQQ